MTEKFKKEVGFIRQSSSKKNIKLQASESSDSFSSFEYGEHRERQEEFSPYRHPTFKEDSFRPRSTPKLKENIKSSTNKEPNPPKFSNLMLRNNFVNELNDEKQKRSREELINQKLGKVEKYQQQVDDMIREEKDGDFQEELSLSNLHKFQKSREREEQPQDKNTKAILKYKHYAEESPSEEEEEDQRHFQKKETVKPGKMKQARHSPAEREEELITEYDKREFKDKRIKAAIIQHENQHPRKDKGPYETRGGICFELDTRQFKGNPKASPPRPKKKKIEADPRAVLMQRRQVAKNYDRQARVKVFGYY